EEWFGNARPASSWRRPRVQVWAKLPGPASTPLGQQCLSREVSAHAVNPATRGCGRGTDEDVLVWRAVGIEADDWSREELAQILDAAIDVAADVIGVVLL